MKYMKGDNVDLYSTERNGSGLRLVGVGVVTNSDSTLGTYVLDCTLYEDGKTRTVIIHPHRNPLYVMVHAGSTIIIEEIEPERNILQTGEININDLCIVQREDWYFLEIVVGINDHEKTYTMCGSTCVYPTEVSQDCAFPYEINKELFINALIRNIKLSVN